MKTIDQLRKINRIISLCVNISQETPHDAFCEYSGHTNCIDIRIHRNGFDPEKAKDMIVMRHYLDRPEFNNDKLFQTYSLEDIEEILKGYLVC